MSCRPAGGGASILEGCRRPPSLRAGHSAALTYSRENNRELIISLSGNHLDKALASFHFPVCLMYIQPALMMQAIPRY